MLVRAPQGKDIFVLRNLVQARKREGGPVSGRPLGFGIVFNVGLLVRPCSSGLARPTSQLWRAFLVCSLPGRQGS